ncbi:MAG TPA: PAS domain S-box protein [Thermodesulfobacteriota bacterium]|nr:PAS domain S-box protein [Thermodesulfobacteriota bacterium]
MSDKDQTEDKEHYLRRRAKELLEERSENLDGLSDIDIRSLVHELRVHQIELEMQNEELHRAQMELQESKGKYADLYDFAPIGYFTLDNNNLIQELNLAGTALLSSEREYLINSHFCSYIAREDQGAFYSYREKLLKSHARQTCELRMIRGDGTRFYVQLEGVAVSDAEGKSTHLRVAMLDITKHKDMEEALKESVAQASKKSRYETIISAITQSVHSSIKLQSVFENAVDATSKNIEGVDNVCIYMVEGEEAVLRTYRGYPDWLIKRLEKIPYPKGFTWKTIIEGKPIYCADVDQDTVIGQAGRDMGTKSYAAMPIHFREKTVGCININSLKKNAFDEEELKLLENVAQRIEIAINNAKQAEALEVSEERFRLLVEGVKDYAIFMLDLQGYVASWNVGAERIKGYKSEEIIGKHFSCFYTEEDIHEGKPQYALKVAEAEGEFEDESLRVRKDGSRFRANVVTTAIRDEAGCLRGFAKVIRDVTERKQAEDALRKAKEELELRVKERTKELVETNEELKKEIIERKRMEDALRESERRFALFMQNLPGAAWIKDIQGRYVYANKVGEKVFRKTLGELLGRTDDEIFPIDTAKQFQENDRSVVMTGQSLQTIETLPQDDGLHYSIVSKFPILDQDGNLIMVGGIAIDITERKQAEEEIKRLNRDLKRRLDELQTLLDVVPVGIAVARDPECKTITVNPAAADMLGVGMEENVSKSRLDADRLPFRLLRDDREVPPEELPMQYAATHNVPIRELELDIVHDNGRVVNSYEYASPLYDEQGNVRGCLGVFVDITERKRAEQELRKSLIQLAKKNRYETIINTIIRSVHQSINLQEVLENAVGAMINNIDGVDFVGIYTVEGTEAVLKAYRNFPDFYIERAGRIQYPKGFTWKAIIEGKPIYCADVDRDTVIGPAGRETGTKSYLSMPISFEAGTVGTISIHSLKKNAFDEEELKLLEAVAGQIEIAIDNAKQAELLRESEKRYRTLVENSYDLVSETNLDGICLYASPKHKEVLGYEPAEFIGRNIFEYIHPDDVPAVMAEYQRAILTLSSGSAVYRYRHKNGGWHWVESTGTAFTTANGEIRGVINSRDITERRRMEEEIAKAQRLESVGILAGGIAHDFNNLLTAILGNISLTRARIDPEDKAFKRLSDAEKACLSASNLTHQLLTFSRGGAPIKRVTIIGELIKESASFVLRGSKAGREFSIPEDLWLIESDEGQISQVVNNLVINADQAMPEGGVIRIKGENVVVGDGDRLPIMKGRYVKVTVEDEGGGIPEEYMSKIFDPYFTTKQSGSGLGLATTYSIIKNHDGYIQVESKVGVGTKFYIYLPASDKTITASKVLKENARVGSGRILVMDDEEIIRQVAGDILSQIGYEVEFAKDGREAIELYKRARESNRPFDAVIMDLTVPGGMGGKLAIEKLISIDPEVKAIVASGYSNDPVMAEYERYGFRGIITKPYKIEELSETICKVINQ